MTPQPKNEPWITESNPEQHFFLGMVGVLVGGLLTMGGWRLGGWASTTTASAFVLGLLILLVALVGLVVGGRQRITVDPTARRIVIEQVTRLGTRQRRIDFAEIGEVTLGENGDREGGSISYHVVLTLKSGKDVALYVGAFDGAFDPLTMERRRQRIADCLA
jgi:hypothetical protein